MPKTKLSCSRDIFQELHYCGLDSQCTVYTLTKFSQDNDGNRLLVAPHNGTIMSVGFHNSLPFSKSMSFAYIPAEAEIIAIDSLNHASGIPVIGIIFVKVSRQRRESSGKSLTSYFNIYSEFGANFNSIPYKGCKTLELMFLPYHLYHTDVYNVDENTPIESIFLISGSDEKIHLFKQVSKDDDGDNDDENLSNSYDEVDVEKYFVEFSSLPGVVTRMQCLNLPAIGRRLSVVGCKDGKVGVYLVDIFKNELLKSYIYEHDDMITSVQIFTLHSYSDANLFKISDFHVLLTSAFEEALVARGVFECGFTSVTALKDSNKFDCVLCSLVADVDFDGESEILLGSYGQKLLVYKLVNHQSAFECFLESNKSKTRTEATLPRLRIGCEAQLEFNISLNDEKASSSSLVSLPPSTMDSSSANNGNDRDIQSCNESGTNSNLISRMNSQNDSVFGGVKSEEVMGNLQKAFEFVLSSSQDFVDPVMGLDLVDLTSDSIDELVVLTANGVHILQKTIDYMLRVFKEKSKFIKDRIEVGSIEISGEAVDCTTSDDDISEKSFITKYE